MRKGLASFTAIFILQKVINCMAKPAADSGGYTQRLWYRQPAAYRNEALPIGNGRMGAMVYGGNGSERLSLNEQTLWSGAPRNLNNAGAKKYLPLVRAARSFYSKQKKAGSIICRQQADNYADRSRSPPAR